MIKLNEGNVLLKPSHRRQVMGSFKRSARLGEQLGNFACTINMHRTGHLYEMSATVRNTAGAFDCRTRQRDWRNCVRDLAHRMVARLHDQRLHGAPAF